jgi:hypothetical protein
VSIIVDNVEVLKVFKTIMLVSSLLTPSERDRGGSAEYTEPEGGGSTFKKPGCIHSLLQVGTLLKSIERLKGIKSNGQKMKNTEKTFFGQ